VPGPAEQAERCAAGLHAHWRTQCAYIAGGEVATYGGLLVTVTNLPDETLNVAFAPGPVTDPDSALRWCVDWFAGRGLRPGIELRVGHQHELESLLAARGFNVVVRRPAMALHPVVLPETSAPRCSVRLVAGDAELRAFQAIQAETFDLTPEVAEAFLPRAAIETPGIAFFLGWYDDVPCATAAATVSEHGVGVVGVATLPAYRRRGLGRLVTSAAVAWGAGRGADHAWLYPSPMARPLYEGLGFRALDETQVWVGPR
jgi:GNAT superfamily N-acetyltransferase